MMRVSLPDRPGSLGAVASAVGTVGADIRSVEIVGKQDGEAVDDFMLTLPNGAMPDNLVSACTAIEGVRVLWFSRYPEGGGLESDIEALERMQQSPEQAPEILTESAPLVFHCHWALLLDTSSRTVAFATEMAPDLTEEGVRALEPVDQTHSVELAADWLPSWGETTVAMAPVGDSRTLVIGRQGGPSFLASEMARLKHLAGLAAG
ncbi:amino acid-binding protein [Auraticoccus sp. F435]|uniref:Amino acid-binding protein n=1 Tax=Auraticoccus cholistanensis TaxID=2656650 RepID=A0A6A9UWE6_9ACTN|nr:amino acid-binding protein [Auraticoccus cholistanensis]MVA75995.1 amino acid-binding protein [Auraticoccus cholistanensis]